MNHKSGSKYWDDFERRIVETVDAIMSDDKLPVRRVAVFITNRCNFKCHYCNVSQNTNQLSRDALGDIVAKYEDAIIHITGGEPSIVPWLYDFIDSNKHVRFHLNTNAYIKPPRNIQRLKVSLDSHDMDYFDSIVQVKGAFNKVISNVKDSCKRTITTLTCTLTRENYTQAPDFMKWCRSTFPDLYAVFFSVYKGASPRFVFTGNDADIFFNKVMPELEKQMDKESLALIHETIDEKSRIMQGARFPENDKTEPCFISMSERVIDANGHEWNCSHLYRDGILQADNQKHDKCLYGCNRRLVAFNQEVQRQLNNMEHHH